MKSALMLETAIKFLAGVILAGALLFLPSGTLAYPNAWLFMALLFVPMFFLGVFLLLRAPELLKKRLNGKEKEAEQKGVVAASGLAFISSFVLAGLDFRFGWSSVPAYLTAGASAIMLAAYGMYAEAMRENAYLSRTVEVQKGQKLIDTGLYGVVRHPMYSATILLYLAIPVVLGSWIAFLVMLAYPALIVRRIRNEEKILEEGLAGYADYKRRVKYRLIPFVW